jgi:antitoxin VapB
MNLQIRDPRAYELARKLAEKRKITMTEAVIEALEAQLGEEKARRTQDPLVERHAAFAKRLKALGTGEERDMTKNEIDEMWGQ